MEFVISKSAQHIQITRKSLKIRPDTKKKKKSHSEGSPPPTRYVSHCSDKAVKLVGGKSAINRDYTVKFLLKSFKKGMVNL